MRLLYNIIKIFFTLILNTFFREIRVIGRHNLPKRGPCIIVGNHNNQYIDALLMIIISSMEINFVIDLKSTWDFYIKPFLWFINVIPTPRPIDYKFEGKGKIDQYEKQRRVLVGVGTQFKKQVRVKDYVFVKNMRCSFVVTNVFSDTELEAKPENTCKSVDKLVLQRPSEFIISPRQNQTACINKILNLLKQKRLIGIFPEGGSHDQTRLLPLKKGVAVFVAKMLQKHNVKVPVVCIGLNYARRHRFRGKVVIKISKQLHFNISKRELASKANRELQIGNIMKQIKIALQDSMVSADTFQNLINLYTIREIYFYGNWKFQIRNEFTLFQKFCKFYNQNREKRVFQREMAKVQAFRKNLKVSGLTVEHLIGYKRTFRLDVVCLLWEFIQIFLACVPVLLFHLPLKNFINGVVKKRQQRSLKRSFVKIDANDVVASWKIWYCILTIPVFFLFYTFLFYMLWGYFGLPLPLQSSLFFMLVLGVMVKVSVRSFDRLRYKFNIVLLRMKQYTFRRKAFYKKIKELNQSKREIMDFWVKVVLDQPELFLENVKDKIKFERRKYDVKE